MATSRTRKTESESVSQVPQSTPIGFGVGAPSHDFTLQAVMELQKTVGEMNANLQAMSRSLDGVKTKVDDLVGWKHKIIGGAAALGLAATIIGFLLGKASEYITVKVPAQVAPVVTPPSSQTQAPPAVPPPSPNKP